MIFPLLLAAGLSAAQTGAPSDLEGRYRLSLELPVVQRAPVFGVFERTVRLLALVDIRVRDGRARQQPSACSLDATGGRVAQVSVPDAFVDALAIPASALEVQGDRLTTELGGIHLGYQPEAADSPPPESASDSSVVDADQDGHPGVTVELSLFELGELKVFVAQHYHLRLVGERAGEERYQGKVQVIDFAQSAFGSEPELPGGVGDLTLHASQGTFTLEKVAPETTCGDL